MRPGDEPRKILFVALKKEAQPVLAQLRGLGHGVSLVEDLEEAAVLLASGGFQHAVLPARVLTGLLEERSRWVGADAESWRRSIAGLSHDIEYLLQSLRRGVLEGGDGDDAEEAARTIAVLTQYLSELASELDMPPGRELQPVIVDLEESVEAAAVTVYPTAAERRQRLVINIDEAATSVRADAVKLKRILATLLDYASRHTGSRGSVTVRAYVEQGEPLVCVSYPGEEMTPQEIQQLFGPQGDRESSSGLSRVRSLVEQHGCRLWLESERGVSTDIYLALPRWSYVKAAHAAHS